MLAIEREQAERRRFSGQRNHSARYYNGGYMSLRICRPPQNVQHQGELRVKVMCRCRLIDRDKGAAVVGVAGSGEGCAGSGLGI